ncbi:hypothetical protein NE865_07613 [Phthorimaea operculella]|nr:hypothetical protein NE865_07613 [Phthorimaea operculella]
MDHVMFPRFWAEEPALWFAQIESVFALNNITSDIDKYDYVLCELPSTVIRLMKDIILDTSRKYDDGKYERIKNAVIKKISITELEKEEKSTMKPSDFFKYLTMKADPRVTEDTVKEVWMKKLPLHVRSIISELKGDSQSPCTLADTVEAYISTPSQDKIEEVSEMSTENDVSDVNKIMRKIGAQFEVIQTELIKFNMLYSENNSKLENIQSELHKFKVAYSEINRRLDSIQSEIKLACYKENNNSKTTCNICEKDKSITNGGHQSISDESTDCKNDDSINIFYKKRKKILMISP